MLNCWFNDAATDAADAAVTDDRTSDDVAAARDDVGDTTADDAVAHLLGCNNTNILSHGLLQDPLIN